MTQMAIILHFKWTVTKRTPIFDLVTFVSQQQHTPSSLKLPKVSARSGGPPILTLYQPLPLTVTFTNHLGNSTPPQKIFLCRCKIHLTYFDYPDACCGVRFFNVAKAHRIVLKVPHMVRVYGFRFSLALPANRLIAKRPGRMTFQMSPSYTCFSLPREDTVSS